ncbi:MAG: hypothetical protein ROW52_14145 [Anaerolineaceae bacterium]|jgi:hypothetical protein
MVRVEKIDTQSKRDVRRFIKLYFDIHKNLPRWVPPFIGDLKLMLNRQKHPFYEHSDGDFFLALRGDEVVGRLAVLENKPFNKYHETKKAQFYFFDCYDDQEAANTLFERGFEWARARGLNEIVGPKGLSAFDGYGIQVEGLELRQMMNMMNYNPGYYARLVETIGFEKEVDFASCYIDPKNFHIPESVYEIARRVRQRGTFQVKTFRSKRELMDWALRIGRAYNETFINNWEYYPLSDKEIDYVKNNLLAFADHRLIKLITYNDTEVIGFLLGFPDVSAAMQRHGGRLTPWAIADLLLEMRRTEWLSLNGVGVLPKYHGRGANALLYVEMEKTLQDYKFKHAELTQMAETAVQVRKDMVSVGAQIYKVHRVYHRSI